MWPSTLKSLPSLNGLVWSFLGSANFITPGIDSETLDECVNGRSLFFDPHKRVSQIWAINSNGTCVGPVCSRGGVISMSFPFLTLLTAAFCCLSWHLCAEVSMVTIIYETIIRVGHLDKIVINFVFILKKTGGQNILAKMSRVNCSRTPKHERCEFRLFLIYGEWGI